MLRESRRRFASSFSVQNATRDFGVRVFGHPRCRCQKQPWTKITRRLPVNTRSGDPGRCRACSRYRKPIAWTNRRTTISGRVSRPRTSAMISLRRDGETLSTGDQIELTNFVSAARSASRGRPCRMGPR